MTSQNNVTNEWTSQYKLQYEVLVKILQDHNTFWVDEKQNRILW